jgi:hypothetical protein
MQVIGHQLAVARVELAAATLQELTAETARLDAVRVEAGHRAGEYEYAAAVYGHLAAEHRRQEAQAEHRLLRSLERRHQVEGRAL